MGSVFQSVGWAISDMTEVRLFYSRQGRATTDKKGCLTASLFNLQTLQKNVNHSSVMVSPAYDLVFSRISYHYCNLSSVNYIVKCSFKSLSPSMEWGKLFLN